MIELTPRAEEVLRRAEQAARRLNPGARIRLARAGDGITATLVETPGEGDTSIAVGDLVINVERGLEGVVDAGEHDALIVLPAREPHK